MFAPLHEAVAAAKAGRHRGGMNLTALSMLEQRAYGWYHYFANHWNESESSKLHGAEIYLDRQATGTETGLAKMPYLRDTRRSVGINGFRFEYSQISHPVNFADTVAIGSYYSGEYVYKFRPKIRSKLCLLLCILVPRSRYAHDTHGLSTCAMPAYLHAPAARPCLLQPTIFH